MIYQYIAYNEKGELVKGKLPAANEEVATNLLGYAGFQAINLKTYVPFLNLSKISTRFFRVKPAEIILIYRQLATLLESGIDIVASLELLREQASNHNLKSALGEVITDLRGGNQFSAALEKHSEIFPPIYCRLLNIGEQSGDLETVLKQVADYMEKEVVTAKGTKNALLYPMITSLVTLVVICLLVTFVIPAFGSLYGSLGVELPASARILINAAGTIQSNWVYLLLGVSLVAGAALIYLRTPGGRYQWDKLVFKLPLVGRVIQLNELIRYCRSLSLMLQVGLPLTEVMPLVVKSSDNRAIAKALVDVQEDMIKGEGLSGPMSKNNLFLPMMVQMVRIGEETGNLDATLLAVAQSYEAEAEDKTGRLIALIQPTMTLIIGLGIGLIALSMTSAMYSIYGQGF
jgi:type IV pilus assembly protein PilC